MKTLATLLALAPLALAAHNGAHIHPHGYEAVIALVAIVASGAAALYFRGRK